MFKRYLPFFAPDGEGGGGSGDGASGSSSWFETLPDDMKANESLSVWKDKTPADVLTSHVALETKMKDALFVPGENATDDERKTFNERMRIINQVPEKPDGYSLTLPEGVPKDDPLLVSVVNKAHEAGLPANGIQAVINGFMDYVAAAEKQAQATLDQNVTALKVELGSAYEQSVKDAETTMRLVGEEAGYKNDEVVAMIENTGLKNNPMFMKMFLKIHRFYKEGQLGGSGSPPSGKTLAEKFFPGASGIT
ncbi:MAG: hypothetical protein PHI86_06075 [Candidatus Omnitrophica bacterium]|nr:hypothetical protein [Candidatus Omnitrophota bacterium]